MLYDINNVGMSKKTVKALILLAPFEVAYDTVCRFITRRQVKSMHKRIIRHISRSKKSIDLAPRGHGKSTIGDVDYCITKILREPNIRILIASKSQSQANAFLMEVRTHLEQNEVLIDTFGNLKGSIWNEDEFLINTRTEIKKEATITALGSSGAVVSKHFDVIIGDDLVGFENARTKGQRDKLEEWFYSSLYPTLEPDGEIHILGTRYHPLDLYQTLIDTGTYTVQVQSAINKFDSNNPAHKVMLQTGELEPDIKDGQEFSLWEEKFSLETLHVTREDSGSIIFGMQYQNSTDMAKGDIFKAKYFKYYDSYSIEDGQVYIEMTDSEGRFKKIPVDIYFGVDLAISQKETADFFVLMVIGVDANNNIYVIDYVRDKLSFDKQMTKIMEYGEKKYPMVTKIGIEAVQYQRVLGQELRRQTLLPIMDINTTKDKVSRAMVLSARFESGKVFFRKNMGILEEELVFFPDAEHDDMVDGLDFAYTTAKSGSIGRVRKVNLAF